MAGRDPRQLHLCISLKKDEIRGTETGLMVKGCRRGNVKTLVKGTNIREECVQHGEYSKNTAAAKLHTHTLLHA